MSAAHTYAQAHKAAQQFASEGRDNDPTQRLYMLARAAILQIRDQSGQRRAAELCYALGDEMTGDAT